MNTLKELYNKADYKDELGMLFNGDCLDILNNIPDKSISLLLTDPPYGINYQSQRSKNKNDRKPKIKNDKTPFTSFITPTLHKISDSGGGYIFTRWDVQQQFVNEMLLNNTKPKNVIIWDKIVHGMGDLKRAYGSRYESIIWYANKDFRFPNKRPTDILRYQRISANKLIHPNEKPIELLEELIKNSTNENDIVLDLFMGSGSTCVACRNTNRRYIGIELDKKYFDIAVERIKNI